MNKKVLFSFISVVVLLFITACGAEETEKPAPSSIGKDGYKELIIPNNELGFKMLSAIDPDDKGNIFISPTSLLMALSMAYNGAEGATKEEIAEALQMEGIDVDTLNNTNAAFINHLQRETKSIELAIANSIWLNEIYHFKNGFEKNVKKHFDAEVEEINVSDAKSANKINDWVSKATNGKIEEMVEAPLDPNLVAYLLNAIYFKGDWMYEFDEKDTEQKPFHLSGGDTKEVSMMSLTEKVGYMENELFQAVELPYGEDELTMRVFLPNEQKDINQVYDALTKENWTSWLDEFEVKKGTVQLPKFQLSYESSLNELLKQFGMHRAFEKGAEFGQMIQEDIPIWISAIKQKTFIDVNEKGTEAAAVTGIEFETTSLPIDEPFMMTMDRPFFATITDDESGAILFLGVIANPEEI